MFQSCRCSVRRNVYVRLAAAAGAHLSGMRRPSPSCRSVCVHAHAAGPSKASQPPRHHRSVAAAEMTK